MKKMTLLTALLCCTTWSHAALEALDNQAMTDVTGQGGADISLQLRLNHDTNAGFVCANNRLEYCRVGLSINNRYADGSYRDALGAIRTSTGAVKTADGGQVGLKQWLVFKGIQGTINIQKIGLDGADLTYTSKALTPITKPVIQLSFDPLKPIQFRNVGYQSLAIETDTVANEGAGNRPGYLGKGSETGSGGTGTGAFVDGKYTTAGFDFDREVGFTGLNINGNLAIAGTIKVFSCDADHPRC